jgi:hypothetical protein
MVNRRTSLVLPSLHSFTARLFSLRASTTQAVRASARIKSPVVTFDSYLILEKVLASIQTFVPGARTLFFLAEAALTSAGRYPKAREKVWSTVSW